MINKINYQFSAIQPIHTGSDEKGGIFRSLRRIERHVKNPPPVRTRFLPEQEKEKRLAISLLLMRLWDAMDNKARVTIYEEMASWLLSSASARTKSGFLQNMCRKMEIREATNSDSRRFDILDILDMFDDYDMLKYIRENHHILMLQFRHIKDETIAWRKANKDQKTTRSDIKAGSLFGDEAAPESPEMLIQSALTTIANQPIVEYRSDSRVERVPTISGNSIRGALRRIVMGDYAKLIDCNSIPPRQFHMLTTGGVIDESTGFETLGERREMINVCPMIGLFGTAKGNGTLQGALICSSADVHCIENGHATDRSYHESLAVTFQTRLDTEKLNSEFSVEITDQDIAEATAAMRAKNPNVKIEEIEKAIEELKKKQTVQMKYEYEVFISGSQFQHTIGYNTGNPLIISAFWRMIELFKQNNYICAMKKVGNGEIDLSALDVPDGATELYVSHVQSMRDEAMRLFKFKKV